MRTVPGPLRVYPRVCGGTPFAGILSWSRGGLSPRVRGNRSRRAYQYVPQGSIPACAGEPCDHPCNESSSPVYPRVCGGTVRGGCHQRERGGLSPRVRGNPWSSCARSRTVGSIPACAGEPLKTGKPVVARKVYPRVCGGTTRRVRVGWLHMGLSPRVRGNLYGVLCISTSPGSIPACAGEPPMARRNPFATRVYPRVCGGTHADNADLHMFPGLSPRVRGNPGVLIAIRAYSGSIPACAGEPLSTARSTPACRVYPRVCGGTYRTHPNHVGREGLSPRVRGNL